MMNWKREELPHRLKMDDRVGLLGIKLYELDEGDRRIDSSGGEMDQIFS